MPFPSSENKMSFPVEKPLPDHATAGLEEVIPSARLPSVELLSPTSPGLAAMGNSGSSSSNNSSSSSGGAGSNGGSTSSDQGVGGKRQGGRVVEGIKAGGALGAAWEEEKEGQERREGVPLLGGERR